MMAPFFVAVRGVGGARALLQRADGRFPAPRGGFAGLFGGGRRSHGMVEGLEATQIR